MINDCLKIVKMLQASFKKVEEEAKSSKDGSVLDFYRTLLLRLGKAHRVETLMSSVCGRQCTGN